jgi:hypothetical protein
MPRWIVFALVAMFLQPAAYPPRRLRLLFFTMKGCLPCRLSKDELKKFEKAGWNVGSADWNHIQVVDSRDDDPVCDQFRISSFPAFILTYDGKELWRRPWRNGDRSPAFVQEALDARNSYANTGAIPVKAAPKKAWPGYPRLHARQYWNGCPNWTHLTIGEHRGKFHHGWLQSLSQDAIQRLHADDHEGVVDWSSVVRP